VIRTIVLSISLLCLSSCNRDVEVAEPPRTEAPPKVVAARSAEDVVKDFGSRMKQVSITAPPETAARSIRETYGGLVDPSLLDAWASSPADAPGRAVSSPWPDRIEVKSSSQSGEETIVAGEIVEATSTGEARRVPIEIRLRRTNGEWLITAFEVKSDAVAVIDDYYRAINARDFERAYRAWGDSGPPGQTLDQFIAGFADTQSVDVKTGAPSRVEGAAGSRYVTVPVTIVATTRDGATQRFEGTYSLRRSVVDGATAAQRAWHIHRAEIRRSQSTVRRNPSSMPIGSGRLAALRRREPSSTLRSCSPAFAGPFSARVPTPAARAIAA
jgi:hypothetical protein